MVAADDDRRLQFARAHHLVEREAGTMALAEAEPADARRQPLESDPLACEVEPPVQAFILREEFPDLRIGARDILRLAGERYPAKGAFADAEERTHVRGHEARIVERVLHAGVLRLLPDVVAVVDARDAHCLEAEDGAYVLGDRLARRERDLVGFALLQVFPLAERPVLGQIAMRRVVRRGLVGDERRAKRRALRALE